MIRPTSDYNILLYLDDGYYEDMYPEVEERPLRRPDTALSVGIFSDAGLDDDIALEEAEEWTRDHPLSAGLANQGFEVSILSVYTYKYGNILKKSVPFF